MGHAVVEWVGGSWWGGVGWVMQWWGGVGHAGVGWGGTFGGRSCSRSGVG